MTDLPKFTADDFRLASSVMTADASSKMVNRRLAEWKAGLTVVYMEHADLDTTTGFKCARDTHQAYIFGVSEIKKGVSKREITTYLRAIAIAAGKKEWDDFQNSMNELADQIEREGIINE